MENTVFFHGTSIFLGLFPWFSHGFPVVFPSSETSPPPAAGAPTPRQARADRSAAADR